MYRYVLTGALITVIGCQETPPLYPASAPPDVREACALAERKCTLCHDRERIVAARHDAAEWHTTIERMRRFAASGITPEDSDIILRCLSYNAVSSVPSPAWNLLANQDNRPAPPIEPDTAP